MTTTAVKPHANDFLERGLGYLHRAQRMSRSYNVVKPVLLYSIVSMAIENMAMFLLVQRDQLPYNHTMIDLIEALDSCDLMTPVIKAGMMRIEKVFNLCDLSYGAPMEPSEEEIWDFLETAERMEKIIEAERVCA